jgi:indolepyruvate ferredoxin oxidoreductase alpha subunit
MKKLLTGNEAIAEGIIESGVEVVSGYPGTPSTEVITSLIPMAKDLNIRVEWDINEKVALEIAAGAAWAGKRAMVTMKMSGLNVTADSLCSIAYSGFTGGLVIYVADDPGTAAGMTEQDSRYYAKSMIIPMLDASNQQETLDFTKIAFGVSERIGGPVFLRLTSEVAHVASDVQYEESIFKDKSTPFFERNIAKYSKAKALFCMNQHQEALDRLEEARKIADLEIEIDKIHYEGKLGVIVSGSPWMNLEEAISKYKLKLSWLKLGMIYPFSQKTIKSFLDKVDKVLILEELDPFIEEEILKIAGQYEKKIKIMGKLDNTLPKVGNYSFDIVKKALETFLEIKLENEVSQEIVEKAKNLEVSRPSSFCAGCPHRGTYYALNQAIKQLKYKKEDIIVSGDIGCNFLGANPPFNSCWSEVSMGASIGIAQGLKLAGIEKPVIATLGDGTFFHSGIAPLINAVYHNIPLTIIILDNGWTAQTGFQENPGTVDLNEGKKNKKIELIDLVKGCGVKNVFLTDPYQYKDTLEILKEAIKYKGVSVVISRRECALQASKRKVSLPKYTVNIEKCIGCRKCIKELACPAMSFSFSKENKKGVMQITSACFGCGLCKNICPTGAIEVIANED